MNFRVGQKVVRVGHGNASPDICAAKARAAGYSFPQMNEVVTVKSLNVWPLKTIITLYEHDNSHLIGKWNSSPLEPGFDASAFRPVCESSTDISIFTAMLTPSKKEVDA